jgi:hypothetical protein
VLEGRRRGSTDRWGRAASERKEGARLGLRDRGKLGRRGCRAVRGRGERGVGRRGPCGRKEGEGEGWAEPKGLGLLSSFLLFLFLFYTQIIQTNPYEFK